jgi:hypothetical protein
MSYSSFELLDHSKPIVVFGRDGQVGRALQVCLKDLKVPVVFLGRSDCDLSNEVSIRNVLNRYQPQVIINAAAYTAVDKAENADQRELAFAINATAPKVMAQYAAGVAHGILVHYSTDYVFADAKKSAYLETDAVWFDMGIPVGLGGDGSTKSLAIGAKDIANTSGSNLGWSLGSSYSTALNNNRYRLSIIFNKNSTKTITQVTSS